MHGKVYETYRAIQKNLIIFFCICSPLFILEAKEYSEYNHERLYSFEKMPPNVFCGQASSLNISNEHFKHLKNNIEWHWNDLNEYWSIKDQIGYVTPKTKKDSYVSTFVFWVYAKTPIINKKLKVQFLKQGEVQCFFEYGLDFTGWRGAWIAFDRDMQGTPVEEMDEVRFSVPEAQEGRLFFDHILLSSMQDVRHHTADVQAPYINEKTSSHWLVLYKSWVKDFDIPFEQKVSEKTKQDVYEIEKRTKILLLSGKQRKPIEELRESVSSYRITENTDGTPKGIPVFYERYGETYEMLGADKYDVIYNNIMGVKKFNNILLDLATAYHQAANHIERDEIEAMFIRMVRHLLDQGFQAGSAMGTLHHLGYSMRDFYPAMFLMEKPLEKAHLKHTVQQAMEWFSGTGELKTKPVESGMNIDIFNTNLISRLTSILMIDSLSEKIHYLHAFTRWLNNGYAYAEGVRGSFKTDGSIFHHCHNYPAYAVGGLQGAIEAVYLLRHTAFSISEERHGILKKALMSMRIYCNLRTWPLSLSGRHPDGKGHLIPSHFRLLALAGSPDGKDTVDKELAEAFLRLAPINSPHRHEFENAGFKAEQSPNGNWTFNYSCLNAHRRDNWLVSSMGHSRYLWSSEGYRGENLFGRYMTHGALQILATGNPISNEGSGFRQEGWDWNHFPGTTVTVLPVKDLKADVKSLDDVSGYEEMLLSDEAFAGGISIQQKQGAFAMKLHEHDKYNGSLRARKSVFFFDNRIVALGSNIESGLENETHTTLFQNYLDDINKPCLIDKTENTTFPYTEKLKKSQTLLSDGLNNFFFIRNGEVVIRKSNQQSYHEETGAPTSNNFATAYINHGSKPRNGAYEYMILIQPTQQEIREVSENMASAESNLYTVLQHDSSAHIVYDNYSKTTGYVLFESGAVSTGKLLKEVNLPCLIMTSEINKNTYVLSACNPDLNFYEGSADEIYDENGKRIERSVYSRKWINNPSGVSLLKIRLAGQWILVDEHPYIKNEVFGDYTDLSIECRHGLSYEATIRKKTVSKK